MENLQKKIDAKRETIDDAERSFKDLKKESKRSGSASAKYVIVICHLPECVL